MGYTEEAMVLKLAGEAAAQHLLSIKRKGEEVLKQPGAVEGSLKDAMVKLRQYEGGLEVAVPVVQAAYTVSCALPAESDDSTATPGEHPPSRDSTSDGCFWQIVMQGSTPVFPISEKRKAAAKARVEASKAYSERLKVKEQQRQYDRMVKNVHWGGGKPKDPEERGMYQASVGLNMVTAAATAGFVAYYFGRQVFRKDSHSIIFGGAAAVGLLIIEMILYIIRTYELDRFKEQREAVELMGQRGMQIPPSGLMALTKTKKQ